MLIKSVYFCKGALCAFIFIAFMLSSAFGGISTYTYDDIYRLTRVERSDGTVIEYQYDNVGNRIGKIVSSTPTLKTPTLNLPVNGAVNQPTSISLSWNDTNTNPQEQGYALRVRPAGGLYTEYNTSQNATSLALSLQYSTTYYWGVKAVGNGSSTLDSAWSEERSFTTVVPDTTPNPFSFVDQTNVALSTVITSNYIIVSGINVAAAISITGGTYSINGGSYTNAPGMVSNGNTVRVQITSSANYSNTTNATLTIGGVSDTFSVTTAIPLTLTITKTGNGSGTLTASDLSCIDNTCTGIYPSGQTVWVAAWAASGSTLTGWTGCDSVNGNNCAVTMSADRSVTATFALNTLTLTATKQGDGAGSFSAPGLHCLEDTCTGFYPPGSVINIKTFPDSGTLFEGWSNCDSISGNVCTINMSTDRSIAGTFTISDDPLDNWYRRNPRIPGKWMNAVAFGNNTFVAVGNAEDEYYGTGAILTSPDGSNWTERRSGLQRYSYLNNVAYGNGTFVTIGYLESDDFWGSIILTSSDGIDWTEHYSGSDEEMNSIIYGNNVFVAVGYSGTILTSPDGTTWSPQQSGTTNSLYSVAYDNNTFVAVGRSGTVLTSPDGITWTQQQSGTTASLNGVAYGNNSFVVVGYRYESGVGYIDVILASPDGINWSPSEPGTTGMPSNIIFGNDMFVAMGSYGVILTSSNGSTWTQQQVTQGDEELNGLTYGNGIFVAVGWPGTVMTSSNGTAWTPQQSGATSYLNSIAYGNNTFVALAETIVTSSDGVTWTQIPGYYDLSSVAYGNNTFVAVGSPGAIFTSSDGITWTPQQSGTTGYLSTITYGNNTFVAVGDYYVSGVGYVDIILTSPDGIIWTQSQPGTSSNPNNIAYGNGTFVVVGWSGNILTSPDGNLWTERDIDPDIDLSGVTYGNNTFVTVGSKYIESDDYSYTAIFTSPDGITWTERQVEVKGMLASVTYAEGIFVATGYLGGVILTSPDGITWTQRNLGSVDSLLGIAYGNGTFVAVGYAGAIFQSGSLSSNANLTVSKSGIGSGTVTSNPAGISCGSGGNDCTESYGYGTVVTLTATADPGSIFVSWADCDTPVDNVCTVSMAASKTITAVFTSNPIMAPTGLRGIAADGSVELHWDANLDPDLAGYTIYYGTTSGQYGTTIPVGRNTTAYTVLNLNNGTLYCLAITATNTWGTESTLSMEIEVTPGSGTSPIIDFDHDTRTDLSVWRPSDGTWYIIRSSDGTAVQVQWGTGTAFAESDIPVPGDYDGDHSTDIAVWRPSDGTWYIIRSFDGNVVQTQWGTTGDVPVPGDYDGDHRTDIAIWRPSDGTWYIIRSSDGTAVQIQWGTGTAFAESDIPVPGDYDGDYKTDLAVWRPSDGTWYIIRSFDGTVVQTQWGTTGDIPVPGDYDGDYKTDLAVWRPSDGTWYIIRSSDGTVVQTQWGTTGDIPVPGNYDGDTRTDLAVWRPTDGTWYVIRSSDGTVAEITWGTAGDVPIGK